MKNNFSNLSARPLGMFLLLLLTVFISNFIFLLVSEIGLNYLWSINIKTLAEDVVSQNFNYVNALKFVGLIDQIGTFLIPAIVLIKLNTPLSFLTTKPSIKDVYMIGYSFIILLACTNLLTLFSHNIDLPFVSENWKAYFRSQQLMQETIQANFIGNSLGSLLINICVMAITPAICEELFFRGVLQRILIKWSNNNFIGILFSSLIFGLLHLQIENFLAIVFASVLFGYLYNIKRNIIYTILIHFCFNTFSLITMQLINNEICSEEFLTKIINYGVSPLGIFIGIVWIYKYKYVKRK